MRRRRASCRCRSCRSRERSRITLPRPLTGLFGRGGGHFCSYGQNRNWVNICCSLMMNKRWVIVFFGSPTSCFLLLLGPTKEHKCLDLTNNYTFFSGLSNRFHWLFLISCSSSNLAVTSSMESCRRSQNPAKSWDVGLGMALGSWKKTKNNLISDVETKKSNF